MDRRKFIKLTAVTGASVALASCGHPENQIIRFIPEDEFVPGVEVWKPSVCPLCAAGCGLKVRVLDADIEVVRGGERGVMRAAVAKKLEGFPGHPVNRGRLCTRGQAAIQITYHPDRLRHPLKRTGARGTGEYQEISWDDGIKELVAKLDELAGSGRQKSLAFVSGPPVGPRSDLIAVFTQRIGGQLVRISLLDEEVLRAANGASFGRHQLPTFDLARARFVISFGADFLGTWNSPVAQAAAYGDMRQGALGQRGAFAQVESRMSQTGANADYWVPANPGTEGALALGIAHLIMKSGLAQASAAGAAGAAISGWSAGLINFSPEVVEQITGVPVARIEQLARDFASRRPAVAIIGGAALAQTNGLVQAMAVNALNALVGSVETPGGVYFTPSIPGSSAATPPFPHSLYQFANQLANDPAAYGVVLIDQVNPVFLAPKTVRLQDSLARAPFIASFANFFDETSVLADLILPDHSFLEAWTAAVPEAGTMIAAASVAAPVMKPLHSTRATPDVLLDVSRRLGKPLAPPFTAQNFEEFLKERFGALPASVESADPWTTVIERGGYWASPAGTKGEEQRTKNSTPNQEQRRRTGSTSNVTVPVAYAQPEFDGAGETYPFHFLPYASTQFYDGNAAHLPWLQEMPDPITSAMWSNWVELNPRVAADLHVANGDMVEVTSAHGAVRAPAVITPGIAPNVIAMPLGQGHTRFTRYASGRGSNPIEILGPFTQRETGSLAWASTRVRIARAGDGDRELTLFAGSTEEHPHQGR